ncbi:hypothetical protein PVK06_041324 [Gossypium arboreum]|uniref:Uncharacterized protein n=1 Tax=Gossypium arboreum TaxID=29729 RepID=A0ABR0N7X7_GOSAR|nr:hypothetical protein PVK06_041324 [Gossypium arboreum]
MASFMVLHADQFFIINNAWKDINEEFLKPIAAPTLALNLILNLARVIDLIYTEEDVIRKLGSGLGYYPKI